MKYQCTNNPEELFDDVNAFFAHREDCRRKYHQKPKYKPVEVESREEKSKGERVPERFEPNQYEFIIAYLDAKYGHACHRGANCKQRTRDGPAITNLQIHHINQNPGDNRPQNTCWLCEEDNLENRRLSPSESVRQFDEDEKARLRDSAKSVCVSDLRHEAEVLSLEAVDYSKASPEAQLGRVFKERFEDWFIPYMRLHGRITKREAIRTGAYKAGCSTKTIERYLEPLTCMEGNYQEFRESNIIYITLRDHG